MPPEAPRFASLESLPLQVWTARPDGGDVLGWIGCNTDVDEVRRSAEVAHAHAVQLRHELDLALTQCEARG